MATSKTPNNAVRTTSRYYTFFLEKLTFRGKNTDYYMTKAEMNKALCATFERGNIDYTFRPVVYTITNAKMSFAIEANGDTRNDFFAIGCMKFSRLTTIKIALWAGLGKSWVTNYLSV